MITPEKPKDAREIPAYVRHAHVPVLLLIRNRGDRCESGFPLLPHRYRRALQRNRRRTETYRVPGPDRRMQIAFLEGHALLGLCGCCLRANIHFPVENRPRQADHLQELLLLFRGDWFQSPTPYSFITAFGRMMRVHGTPDLRRAQGLKTPWLNAKFVAKEAGGDLLNDTLSLSTFTSF